LRAQPPQPYFEHFELGSKVDMLPAFSDLSGAVYIHDGTAKLVLLHHEATGHHLFLLKSNPVS